MGSERRGLDAWAAIAEIVGAGAVVASLLFVGFEVRRNTAAAQAATYSELVQASNEFLLTLVPDSALTDIVLRGHADPASLTAVDGRRYFNYVRVYWRNMDNAYVQRERGVLSDSEWEVYRGIACDGRITMASTWGDHRNALSPEFVASMDEC